MIARNVLNPYDDAVSAISSDFTDNFSRSSPFTGRLHAARPDARAPATRSTSTQISSPGGFSTPPRTLPGPEEFYNGALESNNAATDTPDVVHARRGAGGCHGPRTSTSSSTGVEPPGPIPAGDETTTELFPKFPFKFCGESFDSVFVNSNGNLTFGGGDPDGFARVTNAHLTGLPRIAGLWDDLNPEAGGSVSFSETSRSITITFTDVPEFVDTGANTFSFTLFAAPRGGHHDRGSTRGQQPLHHRLRRHDRDGRPRRLQLRRADHVGLRAGARPEPARVADDRRRGRDRDLRSLHRARQRPRQPHAPVHRSRRTSATRSSRTTPPTGRRSERRARRLRLRPRPPLGP